jgi:hypothetical protein
LLGGCAAAALAVSARAQVPEWSLRAQQRLKGAEPGDFERRQALLRSGETQLAAGDADAAEADFDRAALMLHAADTEIALVRTYMQLGQFRRALAFCAHTAGVHRDVVAAAALYVWLLHVGGQARVARQHLATAEATYPGEPLLAAVRQQTDSAWPRAEGALRALPARMAPYAPQPALPDSARVAGTATLLPGGAMALAPAATVRGRRQWLRNGLGQTVAARVDGVDADLGLARLVPEQPWTAMPAAAAPEADPFGGRPGYTVEYPRRDDAEADWPLLRLGFLGPLGRDARQRALGLELPPGPRGGPVLDETGRFVGFALPATPRDRWLSARLLRERLGPHLGDPATGDSARIAPDAAYERGLRLALQLIVDD